MSLRFFHVGALIRISCYLRIKKVSHYNEYATIFLSVHSLMDIYVDSTLAVVNNASMNIDIQISAQVPAFNSFFCILRSGIAGSNDNSMCNFLRHNFFFHSGYTIFYFYQQLTRVQFLHILTSTFCFHNSSSSV